ncbi:2452_t:CDS:2, partial [Acaulospora colombiana]
ILGKDRVKFFEKLVVSDLEEMLYGTSTLSLLTNEHGGCADKDLAHIRRELDKVQRQGWLVHMEVVKDYALLALQGPKAAEIIKRLSDRDLTDFKFMTSRFMNIKKIELHITRSGYTGEDGFEVTLTANRFAKLLLGYPSVQFAGLGARDSLRLEAGLCLYGHDLDESITPVEAGLSWTIGAERILRQLNDKSTILRRRIGLIVEGAPARGKVTSGGPSPTLQKNIAMGYVKTECSKVGTSLRVKVRNRMQDAKVVKMPFVPARYYRLNE